MYAYGRHKRHQPAYVLEFATRVGAVAYPVTETNRMIGLELLKYDQLIGKIDEYRSVTIGGDERGLAEAIAGTRRATVHEVIGERADR